MSTVLVTLAVPVVSGPKGDPGPMGPIGPPVIPLSATNYGVLDNNPAWLWQHDSATPGTSTGTSTYVDAISGRNFSFSETLQAGERFSLRLATDTTYPQNFCYDAEVMLTDPSQELNIEMDVNQVLPDGRTCIMDCQCAFGSKSWEFDGWKPSRIRGNPQQWGNTWHHIRIFWHRSADGNTVYFDGVEFDGTWLAAGMTSTTRTKALGWLPVGLLLINFQIEGSKSPSSISAFGRNIQLWSWM